MNPAPNEFSPGRAGSKIAQVSVEKTIQYELESSAMKIKTPTLSICIPTFNRAEILRRTLQSITSQKYFIESEEVEVIVSDNCSIDHTRDVVTEFELKYPNLVRYVSSQMNDEDLNFERALRAGQGDFLKLHNDSFGIHDGLLEPIVKILRKLADSKPVVFFLNESPDKDGDVVMNFDTMDLFLNTVSYKCTWIGGFGIWRDHLTEFSDFSRYFEKRLIQTDVLFRLLATHKKSVVIREQMFPGFGRGRKGGYNIAQVFGENYLSILSEHVADGGLTLKAFSREKKRVLVEHILPFLLDSNHDFQRDNLDHYLRDYVGEDYFIPEVERALGRADQIKYHDAGRGVGAVLPQAKGPEEPMNYHQLWRSANAHNETTPGHVIPLSKVSIGRQTYGVINAWHWGHEDEYLRIGHFCSIGAGVDFILGGNHPTQGFSTYPFKVKYLGHEREAASRGPIFVGDDVWIGNRAMIMSGVTIAQGAVIGAGAVVTRDVPPYAVVAGNPARVVRFRFEAEVIEELMQLDYAHLTDETILKLSNNLYEVITPENVRRVVSALMAMPPDEDNLYQTKAQHKTADPISS